MVLVTPIPETIVARNVNILPKIPFVPPKAFFPSGLALFVSGFKRDFSTDFSA